jgi:translocator protein
MKAIASWLDWRRRGFDGAASALGSFSLQLAFKALSVVPVIWALRKPLAGPVDIVPLGAAILATLLCFWRISPFAGALFVPYWLW